MQLQLDYLEEALPSSIRKHITTLRKAPVQIWAQLDEIFGDPDIVLAEALNDLYNVDQKNLGGDYITVLTKDIKSGFFKAGAANLLTCLLSRRSLEI